MTDILREDFKEILRLVRPSAREAFHRLTQAAFRQRRKQIHNSLVRELPLTRDQVDQALAACAVSPDRRPQTLSVPEWACLTDALGPTLATADG